MSSVSDIDGANLTQKQRGREIACAGLKLTILTILTLAAAAKQTNVTAGDQFFAVDNEVVKNWASGVYLYSVSNGTEVVTLKMMLLK